MATNLLARAVAIICLCTSAQAQVFYIVPGGPNPKPGDPTHIVRLDIEKAIRRALTPPSRPAPPPIQSIQSAPPPPPQATPPAPETREQWRQRLFDEMKSYCTKWPNDTACGPNALSGGSR
ncbi:MAG: hypothetical protein WAL02_14915 [Rhodoplanes sp.]